MSPTRPTGVALADVPLSPAQEVEEALPGLARTVTEECGKTLAEAEGEMRRGIENVEVATGICQPIGVVAIITPFKVHCQLSIANCQFIEPIDQLGDWRS